MIFLRVIARGHRRVREETRGRTLEDAFIALTGHSIREDEVARNFRIRVILRSRSRSAEVMDRSP
jgi:hypothetical protein